MCIRDSCQSGGFEGPLDFAARLLLVFLEHQLVSTRAHEFALGDDFFRLREQRVQNEDGCAAAQFLACDTGEQRSLPVKLAHRADDALALCLHPCAVDIPCLLYTSDAADDLTRVDLG